MPRCWISIGSNIERERNVSGALGALREAFGGLIVSPVYEADAVGFDGEPFYNLIVGIETARAPAELHGLLRDIEARHGRAVDGNRSGSRTLDLDLLTYGSQVTDEGGKHLPRDEILRYAFVLAPLVDVAGDEIHPETGLSFRDHWAVYRGADRERLLMIDCPDCGA